MEDNNQEYLFTPKCFKDDLKKIFKNFKTDTSNINKRLINTDMNVKNRIFEKEDKNSYTYMTSIFADISPGILLEQLKDLTQLKDWFTFVEDINSEMRISQYSDIVNIALNLPFLNFMNAFNQLKLIRYWSYDIEEHSYFLLFKNINNKNLFDNLKSGGFIINVNPEIQNKTGNGCILSFYIKFRKSKYLTVIDQIYKYFCKKFCSSLESFVGSVKMHKYNHEFGKVSHEDAEGVDAYKYLIHFFYNYKNETDEFNNPLVKKDSKRKSSELDQSNLDQMKAYFEIKNELAIKFGENYFTENEIIRFLIATNGDTEKIISALEELDHFRRNFKPNDIKVEELCGCEFDFDNFISILGNDIYKRPVILIRLKFLSSLFNCTDESSLNINLMVVVRYIIYIFSKATEQMTIGIDKFMIIIDSKNAPLFKDSIFSEYAKKLFFIMLKFFPERVSEIWIINKGINFTLNWKYLYKIIDFIGNMKILNKIKISNDFKNELVNLLSNEKIDSI